MPRVVVVTGTPGTGKTTYAKALADYLEFDYIDGRQIIKDARLDEDYDHQRDCSIVDVDAFRRELQREIDEHQGQGLVIDSHMAHDLDPELVHLVVVTTCDRKVLRERLEKRGYHEKKIKENLEVEIFDTCFGEAQDNGHTNIVKVDRTSDTTQDQLLMIRNAL